MTAALLAIFLSAPPPAPQVSETAFKEKIAGQLAACGAPGAALEVFRDGEVIHRQTFGVANADSQTPYSADLAFEIGSLSKQFTAAALLMLVGEEKLSLTDPIGSLLPDLPEAWRSATVEQVMHHVSGIPDYEAIVGYDFYNSEREPREVIESAARREPAFRPGERFEYSNTGYFLLSLVVERESGLAFDRFLEERIFVPLEMRATTTRSPPAGVMPATGHHARSGTLTAQPPIAWSSTLGAGGIVSTLADMRRWDEALYGERLLPGALRSKLWEPTRANDGSTIAYGGGWILDRQRGVACLTHSGQTNAFTCNYLRFPEQRLSVLVHANSYGVGLAATARAAAAHFLPELNYYGLPVPEDPDPECTEEHWAALRQAVLAEGQLDLLASGMKDFATSARFAALRQPLEKQVETSRSFRFLCVQPFEQGPAGTDEFLYRQAHEGGETFWTMRFADGLLVSLDWEDE